MRNRIYLVLLVFLTISLSLPVWASDTDQDQAAVVSEEGSRPIRVDEATGPDLGPFLTAELAGLLSSSPDDDPIPGYCWIESWSSYTCNCNLVGGTRFRKVNYEQLCCTPGGCQAPQQVSSSCTNYAC